MFLGLLLSFKHVNHFFLSSLHQLQDGHEKVAEQISRDVSQLCSQLAALWSRFLEAAVLNSHILSYLAQEHHTLRVSVTRHQRQTGLYKAQTSQFTAHIPRW